METAHFLGTFNMSSINLQALLICLSVIHKLTFPFSRTIQMLLIKPRLILHV